MTRFEKRLDLLPFYLFEPSYFESLTREMERMLDEFGAGRQRKRFDDRVAKPQKVFYERVVLGDLEVRGESVLAGADDELLGR